VTIAALIGVYALYFLLALLLVRLVIGYVMMFNRNFRPTGAVAATLELAYSVTDPPLRLIRRLVPPLRLGRFPIDLSFIVLFATTYILLYLIRPYA
jgi:YggT family protein